MKLDLTPYAGMKICVAVSGGKDSIALLHYVYAHCKEYGITLTALNCDHKIRGKTSAHDSAFVKNWCAERDIPVLLFVWNAYATDNISSNVENRAREWRRECYLSAAQSFGADAIATAHHMNDNAETVLFNVARGSGISGATGISDCLLYGEGARQVKIIRPLISCTRSEIDGYIKENRLRYVTDKTNFKSDYTRNRIRHNILPELESAVPGAVKAVYRFSRIAAEDEEYFDRLIKERNLIIRKQDGVLLPHCEERVVFRRAAIKALRYFGDIKDYTFEHAERLYLLQFAENGKKFCFLDFTAYKEDDGVFICEDGAPQVQSEVAFNEYKCGNSSIFGGQPLKLYFGTAPSVVGEGTKVLRFDADKIPDSAVVRFMKDGDRFTKFGGGTKNLGDYFTDKKIPARVRKTIPVIAVGNDVLAVCGVEISDKIKIMESTQSMCYAVCKDYTRRA